MPNRRDFFKTVAGTAAGMYVMGRGADFLMARQARRQVSIGGRRIRVIDIHAHSAVPEVEPVVKGTPFERQGMVGGNRRLGPERIELLDKQGIDIQALSTNGFWWYAVEDRGLAGRIVRAQNEGTARWVSEHPDRFVALASVGLQHPDLAAEQLEYAVTRLGMRGVAIGGHCNGEDLSLAKYDPFWAKVNEHSLVVFMHPGGADNIIRPGTLEEGRADLGNIIGNPLETTYFLARLIFEGTLDKFPNVRVVGAHAGGFLPSYLGRFEVACDVRGDAECINKKKPSEYLHSQILADSMILTEDGLEHLVNVMTANQVVFGTDNPLNWPVPVDLIVDAPFLDNAQKEAILGGNLIKLLRITT